MLNPTPRPPQKLSAYAREVLEGLAGQPAAREIVIGGGIALAHYVEYRETHDLDAWWETAPSAETRATMTRLMHAIADRHGLEVRQRAWGETESIELLEGPRKVFSLQIASRDQYLQEPVASGWPPVQLETLRDNIASKMTALVERAAPRDFQDIHAVCEAGLATVPQCWSCYLERNPSQSLGDTRTKVLHSLERLEGRRPLAAIEAPAERERAGKVRRWFREAFCRGHDP